MTKDMAINMGIEKIRRKGSSLMNTHPRWIALICHFSSFSQLSITFTLCLVVSCNTAHSQLTFKADIIDYRAGLFTDEIKDIEEEGNGNIYLATNVGLFQYDGQKYTFLHPERSSPGYYQQSGLNSVIYFPKYDKLILTTRNEIVSYEPNIERFDKIIVPPDIGNSTFTNLYVNKTSDSTAFVLEQPQQTMSFRLFKIVLTENSSRWDTIPLIAKGKDIKLKDFRRYYFAPNRKDPSKVFFLADDRIYQIDTETHEIQLMHTVNVSSYDFEGNNQIVHFEETDDGCLLLSIINEGIFIYNPTENKLEPLSTGFSTGETIFTVSRGNADQYWLGSNTGQLYKLDYSSAKRLNVKLGKLNLHGDIIKSIYETSDDKLFISSGNTMYKVDLTVNIFRQFDWMVRPEFEGNFLIKNGILHPTLPIYLFHTFQTNTLWRAHLHTGEMDSIFTIANNNKEDFIFNVYADNNVILYNGKETLLINEYGEVDETFIPPWNKKLSARQHQTAEYFHIDEASNIYIAAQNWLFIQREDGYEYFHAYQPFGKSIRCIKRYQDQLYLCTSDTLYIQNPENKEWLPIHWANPIPDVEYIHVFFEEEYLIIVTKNQGLFKGKIHDMRLETEPVCTHCLQKIGQRITAVSQSDAHHYWLSTNTGLVYYNALNDSYMDYSFNFNLSKHHNYRPFYCNQLGLCAISTVLTLDWASKEDLFPMPQKGQLTFTRIMVNDELINLDNQSPSQPLTLNYNQNNLSFEWSHYFALHPDYYQYDFMLEGLDDDWQTPAEGFNVNYQNLPPGKYHFHLRAHQKRFTNNVLTNTLLFEISPPFWKTWWFILMLVLTTALIIYLIVHQQIKSVKEQAEIKSKYERELNELKLNSLRMQMNPHFMFNSLNSIKNYILKNERETAAQYLSNFAFLIRSVLNFSEEKLIPLHAEVNVLKTYIELECLRFSRGFEYRINVDESIDKDSVMVQPLLLQPFVENAIWHGLMQKDGNRLLTIDIRLEDGNLIYQVTDNGIGRSRSGQLGSKSASRKSFGIQITKSRMESLSDQSFFEIIDLFDSNGNPSGTKVILKSPLIYEEV